MSLTKEERDALPAAMFAVPDKRLLPFHNERHTRMAWSMLPKTADLSDDERRVARSRILRRAHELGIDTSDWETAVKAFNFALSAMSLGMPDVSGHPNRMPFSGVLTRVDQASDAPPEGSRGKRTLIPKNVAEEALSSLLGMAIDYTPNLDGHDTKSKIGLITGANIAGDAIEIEGFFYVADFPEECARIKKEKNLLGFSYEAMVAISDLSADPWVVDFCRFTGAAVLYKHLAAYQTTSLAATAEQDIKMTKEELQELLAAALKPITEAVAAQGTEIAAIKAAGASLGGPIIDQVKPHVEACMAAADKMEAAGVGSHPTMGHAAAMRKIGKHMALEAASGKVPHIFTDHSYFDASPQAVSAQAIKDAVDAAVRPIQAAADAKIAELTAKVADADTKMVDLKAAAFTSSPAPARATLPPQITALLAKANIVDADIKNGKLSTDQVNTMLDAAGLHGQKAIELKLKLRHSGQMEVGKQ